MFTIFDFVSNHEGVPGPDGGLRQSPSGFGFGQKGETQKNRISDGNENDGKEQKAKTALLRRGVVRWLGAGGLQPAHKPSTDGPAP